MATKAVVPGHISWKIFTAFCVSGCLMSIAYGASFLIPLLILERGGSEAIAGLIISSATISTVLLVILSGRIADSIGLMRAIIISAIFLATASFGFAFSQSLGLILVLHGFLLGIGWGIFYTLGPIAIATIIESKKRIKYFALLSGSMMLGICVGPLIGRLVAYYNLPTETTFLIAAIASFLGGIIFYIIKKILPISETQTHRISWQSTHKTALSNAIFPIIMVGLGGCIFGSLSSFQTSYAETYGFDYSVFFVVFMVAAISCRLFLAGYVVQKDPLISSFVLTLMTSFSLLMFIFIAGNDLLYALAALIFGVGYGLTYSVINGQAANEAPDGLMPQSLLLFSLSYVTGVFGFPFIAGNLISHYSIKTMLYVLLAVSILNNIFPAYRLIKAK